MEVTDLWATEFNRRRGGVVLEETDWETLLGDAGVPTDTQLPLVAKFNIMKTQAAVFSLEGMVEALASLGEDPAGPRTVLAARKEELATWLKALKEKYAP